MTPGPVIVGYDGSPASQRAVCKTAQLVNACTVLVVTVWEWHMVLPTVDPMALAPIDIRIALEIELALQEQTQTLAEQGAQLARQYGLDAEGPTVADEITVGATLVRLARERAAAALVVGSHGHAVVREVLLGSTTREVVRRASCPVVVVRGSPDDPDARAAADALGAPHPSAVPSSAAARSARDSTKNAPSAAATDANTTIA